MKLFTVLIDFYDPDLGHMTEDVIEVEADNQYDAWAKGTYMFSQKYPCQPIEFANAEEIPVRC